MRDCIRWFKCKLKPPKNIVCYLLVIVFLGLFPSVLDLLSDLISAKKDGNKKLEKKIRLQKLEYLRE